MIFHVESCTDGYAGRTIHISSNLELAYTFLTNKQDLGDYRRLTFIFELDGSEVETYYDSWNKAAPSIEEIQNSITTYEFGNL